MKNLMTKPSSLVTRDPWTNLKSVTRARLALGRAGSSIPTQPHLEFALAHSRARDAVSAEMDWTGIEKKIKAIHRSVIRVSSSCLSRQEYLLRPDHGRLLSVESKEKLRAFRKKNPSGCDVLFILADGLSPKAMISGLALLKRVKKTLASSSVKLGPFLLAQNARVAFGDEAACILKAKLVVILLGERPGLTTPDSLGAYLTYGPKLKTIDADRNCLSNIGAQGLPIPLASQRLASLITRSLASRLSGVELKDDKKE